MILLIAASILVAGGFLVAFLWSVKNDQYDDDYTPGVRSSVSVKGFVI
ncbi:MAG: cbb3-type cytochrome oxidase assembly protein CcoS [Chitinophagaceae bacterium]